jgi:hypothetical protein
MTDCGAVTADLSHVNFGVQIRYAGIRICLSLMLVRKSGWTTSLEAGSKKTFVALYQPSGEQQMNPQIFRSAFRGVGSTPYINMSLWEAFI